MPVESAADRLAFLETLGNDTATLFDVETSAWMRADGGGWMRADGGYWLRADAAGATSITGIFDNDYVGIFAGGDIDVESSSPAFTCRTADATAVNQGDTMTVDSVIYTVRGVQPDGTGMTTLILESP